ncbi:MAG: hypothetical protein P8188_09900 [Gemmatimonadota bacterium]
MDWIDATVDQWVPYRLDAAAREAFGSTFSREWDRWRDSVEAEARAVVEGLAASGGVTRPDRLTAGGRQAVRPRVAPDGTVVFARADGRSDTQLRRWDPETGTSRFVHRTNGLADVAPALDGRLLAAQLEYVDNFRIRRDLWWIGPDGAETRLTRGTGLDQPDLAPSGRWAVAVRYQGQGSTLVRVDPFSGATHPLPDLPEASVWAFPRVSPDGRWIAATRWSGSGLADVVVLNAESGALVLEATADRALDLAPAWSLDSRTLLWGSDRTGIPQIVAATVDPEARQAGPVQAVTRVATGVAFPAPDPEGRWLYLSEYTADGWELARVPWDPETWTPAPLHPRFQQSPAPGPPPVVLPDSTAAGLGAPAEPYASLPSLLPNYWSPLLLSSVRRRGRDVIEPFVGLETGGQDLVGRHSWAARGAVSLSGQAVGMLGYSWRGLGNPIFTADLQQDWSADGPYAVETRPGEPPEAFWVRERERRLRLGVTLRRTRWRSQASVGVTGGLVWESRTLLDDDLRPTDAVTLRRPDARLWEGRLTLNASTVRGHALSVSAEEGISVSLVGRARFEASLADSVQGVEGRDRSQRDLLGQLQIYQSVPGPGFADHVFALRLAGGFASGPGADQFTWEVGGVQGEAETLTGLSLFGGTGLFFPVRGYDVGVRSGRGAWVASGEYRFPLALVNRGLGLVPLHLDRIHGALFLDAGNAWGPEGGGPGYDQPRQDPVAGAGVEIAARVSLLFRLPLVLRVGAASPLVDGEGVRFYLRLGGTV